ncbi:MAG: hypothetical protein IJO90_02415, partial [Alistipes sp.]|nr:hypothetical protein [Alistipes sp.]
MKRFATYLFALLFVVLSASAQDTDGSALERNVERAKRSLDSLNGELARMRSQYAAKPELRANLANQLLAMEGKALELKGVYDRALAAYISNEQRDYTAKSSTPLQQYKGEDTAAVAKVPNYPKVANLVYNNHFKHYMSAAD